MANLFSFFGFRLNWMGLDEWNTFSFLGLKLKLEMDSCRHFQVCQAFDKNALLNSDHFLFPLACCSSFESSFRSLYMSFSCNFKRKSVNEEIIMPSTLNFRIGIVSLLAFSSNQLINSFSSHLPFTGLEPANSERNDRGSRERRRRRSRRRKKKKINKYSAGSKSKSNLVEFQY